MLTLASNLSAARSQMAFTLGFHIILASLGVALPAMMLIANYRGLRHDDQDALRLARRWWKVIFNPAVSYEVPHMILAAYLVTGFLLAGIYAAGMLRGRRDRLHRLGLLIPLTVACIATPIQFAVGDTAARAIAHDQPVKFAGMECVQTTSTDVTEYVFGRCTSSGMKGGIGSPGLDSFL